jgi:copper(I)-binding protein
MKSPSASGNWPVVSRIAGESIVLKVGWGLLCLGLLSMATPSRAHGYEAGEIRVQHPWARATSAGARHVAVFMRIRNQGSNPERLVSAASPVAARVELRGATSPVAAIDLPARNTVELVPGGTHLLLLEVGRSIAKGERIALLLRFERLGELSIDVEVQGPHARRPRH